MIKALLEEIAYFLLDDVDKSAVDFLLRMQYTHFFTEGAQQDKLSVLVLYYSRTFIEKLTVK